ncbi:winged helix-turn-helix transcriptional regulator [Crossiella sp. SN42]|uniref:winged helix-turn-helix transcriptional regulator n=1 Tax=Crossiella sp. SN42 TaxID=2944808 RepID=UPI00207C443B|nr:winged helix-turn-helix transcriptional regulator [Crossiella sp. SN42]MCO1575305.1 winged helix-turn-helix transcriptional regulator [Crossiella sp. SN42]
MRRTDLSDADCAIAQSLDVVGDWWTLLVLRDVARGVHRFDALQAELGLSRKVLAERLRRLVEHEVLRRERYHEHPPRHEYRLTDRGRGLLPVLIALQDWGSTWLLGDGTLSATSAPESAEARRVRDLVGTRVPELLLPAADNTRRDPVAGSAHTVLYFFPGAGNAPPGWDRIPGAPGCTLEACAYRDRHAEFAARDATVHGVSTQRLDELAAFRAAESLPFPLFSDAELSLVAALRLPTFRAAGAHRLKRLTLVVDRDRVVRAALYPIPDPAGSVDEVLALLDLWHSGADAAFREL